MIREYFKAGYFVVLGGSLAYLSFKILCVVILKVFYG